MTKKDQNTIAWVVAVLVAIYLFFFSKKPITVTVKGEPDGGVISLPVTGGSGISTPVVSTPTTDSKTGTTTIVPSEGSTPIISTPPFLSPSFGGSDSLPPSVPVVETPAVTAASGGGLTASIFGVSTGLTLTPKF